MTAFEQAWALLKQMSDEESQPMYQSTQRQPWTDAMTDALRDDLMTNPNYLSMRSNPNYYFNQDIGRWMPKDDEYYSNKIEQDYGEGGKYSDMSLAEIADEVGFGPTESPSSVITHGPHAGMTREEYWEMIENMPNEPRFVSTENETPISPKLVSYRDRTFQSRLPIDNLMTHNTPDRSTIIDGRYKLPLVHQSLAPITPLKERLPKKPIPSHIEFNPKFGNHGMFELIGTEGQSLSRISPGQPIASLNPNTNPEIRDLYGETPPQFRRQDYYDKLYRGLLNAGISIRSDNRNKMSGPFHEKLMNTMSPNINVTKPRGDTSVYAPIYYSRKDRPNVNIEELKQLEEEIPGIMGMDPNEMEILASDLNPADYGSLPIRIKQPKPQPTNVPASKVGVITPANNTSYQTSLDEYKPSNFRGIDAIKEMHRIRERHRIQNLFGGDDY